MNPPAFLLFGKLPRPGRVKTRLARTIGDEAAAAVARAFLRDASEAYARLPGCDPVVAAEEASDEFWRAEFPPPWRIEEQGDGDLGSRLQRAFRREFAAYGRVAAAGSDHPDLPAEGLAHFLRSDNGLWPTSDGGYAAIVLSRSDAALELFDGIAWSTPEVFSQTVERARKLRIELTLEARADDVDLGPDLERLHERLSRRAPSEPGFPIHTWREILNLARAGART